MYKILLIEDAHESQHFVRGVLARIADVTCVSDEPSALKELSTNQYDLLLLDVQLAEGDGLRLCSQIRSHERLSKTPILFLTGKGELADKVVGFSVGADDYLVKPIDPREFKARIKAHLRKTTQRRFHERLVRFGPVTINLDSYQTLLEEDGKTRVIELTPVEFRLLSALGKNLGSVLTRECLLELVWGGAVHVLDRSIDKHVSSLRQKLGECSKLLQTVSGIGYRLRA